MKIMNVRIAAYFVSILLSASAFASSIVSYRADITPDFSSKSIEGTTVITLDTALMGKEISFPANELVIDSVQLGEKSASHKVDAGRLIIDLPKFEKSTAHVQLSISYHGKPRSGLVFGQDFVYSAFSTCHWMICDEALEKQPIEMQIVVPKDFKIVASGDLISKKNEDSRHTRYVWKQERPYSSYLFGFAAGKFNEATEKYGSVNLRYLGVKDDIKNLKKKFEGTSDAMKFFEKKSGVKFPNSVYTQVLVPNDEAQEMTSFSVIGNDVLDPIVQNPQEDWSIVHELAHQWWGNLLTCKSWKDFWLNEGITVFMTAAYKQERWGETAYQNELGLARKRYQRAVDAGLDVPLTYDKPYPSIQIKRAIVYSKGALFMDALRKEMGEDSFWRGFRTYTIENTGKSVESRDFQLAMEKAAGKKLNAIFDRWVY